MQYFRLVVFATLAATSLSQGADLYMRNGMVYKNVRIEMSGSTLVVDLKDHKENVEVYTMWKIDKVAYDSTKASILVPMDENDRIALKKLFTSNDDIRPSDHERYDGLKSPFKPTVKNNTYPNMVFLSVAILGAGIAWEHLSIAGDLSGSIKTKYYIVGSAAAFVGITFTIYALTPVSISVSPERVDVTYKF